MDVAIAVALIALLGTVGNVALTYSLKARADRRRVDAVWDRYRASLGFSAEELADRIDNVLNRGFLDVYGDHSQYRDEAVASTMYRFCQYFGWSEILRRVMRAPNPRHAAEGKRLSELQGIVGRNFGTDSFGVDAFMIWREAQRAIGELMVAQTGDITDIIGVADFVAQFDKFKPWLHRVEDVMKIPDQRDRRQGLEQSRSRLEAVHAALVDLRRSASQV